jgi:hypothetical protein
LTSIVEEIASTLEAQGKMVNTKPQEKQLLSTEEVTILLEDLTLTSETAITYIMELVYGIIFFCKSDDDVVLGTKELINLIEPSITERNGFEFVGTELTPAGAKYQVELYFKYKEVLQIG